MLFDGGELDPAASELIRVYALAGGDLRGRGSALSGVPEDAGHPVDRKQRFIIKLHFLLSFLRGDERFILNPGNPKPVKLTTADLAHG
ncbi:hypothetical protein G3545_08660 [Starkeya sp. ORNL1]|uniref:hypothetical protein n=1 Tax=Starkeya sp. ORNL1 TaxID=2709380 RepID=UPI001464297D|nr:hypothetical protein [Starkeya sp. ORNL1]QJP13722.1 hypothetical protein G3545_08660 [Starkeya sp. ORNL1]